MPEMKVLIVDDQAAVRTALQVLLDVSGLPCVTAASPAEALAAVREEEIGVVIQDMNFSRDTTSGDEGKELFLAIKELDPDLPVVLVTAWTSLERAVELVKEGAADYIGKPWDDAKLVVTVRNLLALRSARRESYALRAREAGARDRLAKTYDLRGLVYRSRALHELVSLAVHVAPADVPVLITGPNGSGKEKLAEIIQANSRRQKKPFVRVNAGGLPDQLLEAELFGAEPGAYTGANKVRIGRFEAADGGTLFLDEIGNLSPTGQMRLLRALQTGEFERLGSSNTRKVDVRIISATNADLRAEIAAGRFREDLYFRLNVIELSLPPLTRRREDILPLAQRFLELHQGETERRLGDAAVQALEQHEWTGNVRELENRIRRACLIAADPQIEPADLDLGVQRTAAPTLRPSSIPPVRELSNQDSEREALEAALVRAGGVVSRAAAELGLSRQALYRRMERLGVAIERSVR
jgi:DNA-binding NtrC family response regulator